MSICIPNSLGTRFTNILHSYAQDEGLPFASVLTEEQIQRAADEEGVSFGRGSEGKLTFVGGVLMCHFRPCGVYLQRYQCMVAARQQDPVLLKKEYRTTRHVMLSIDGLQPEKGHETLYVVRELGQQRVWFAQALWSSATSEIRPLIVQAREWAERLERPVRLWMSDKQDAFVTIPARRDQGVPRCAASLLRQPFFA